MKIALPGSIAGILPGLPKENKLLRIIYEEPLKVGFQFM